MSKLRAVWLSLMVIVLIVILANRAKTDTKPSTPGVFRVSNVRDTYGGTAASVQLSNGDIITLTNRHICAGQLKLLAPGPSHTLVFMVRKISPVVDLCLLSSNSDTGFKLAKDYTRGEAVVTIGYPLGLYRISQATIMGLDYVTQANELFIHFQGPVDHGSSGSPILNKNNELLGLVAAMRPGYPEYGLAVTLEQIKDFLNEK